MGAEMLKLKYECRILTRRYCVNQCNLQKVNVRRKGHLHAKPALCKTTARANLILSAERAFGQTLTDQTEIMSMSSARLVELHAC